VRLQEADHDFFKPVYPILMVSIARTGYQGMLFSKGFRNEADYGVVYHLSKRRPKREDGMPIIFAVDEEKQIIHIITNSQSTDEEYYKNMSELISVVTKFDKPKLLIENPDYTNKTDKHWLKRVKTVNLETIKYLKKIAIFNHYEIGVLIEVPNYCSNRNTSCEIFNNIDYAKEWLKAE
jgi:hypothetical protein